MDEKNQANLDASVQDVDTSVDNDTNDTSGDDTRYLNQKLRAEKAEKEKKELEAELALLKKETKPAQEAKPVETGLSEDDILVISRVQDKESIDMIRKVAKLEGITLTEAEQNPLYRSWANQRAEEKRQEQSQMGASKGSGSRKQTKDLSTPRLSEEEHKELWKKLSR